MIKIALGTTSKWKTQVLKEILEETKIKADFEPISVDTGVLSQPRGENETKAGSVNRAKKALELNPEAEIGMGIEFGYEPVDGIYLMHAWSSIVDKSGSVFSEQSSTLELPKYFYAFLHDQDEIGHHVEEFKAMSNQADWQHFAEIIQYRLPFIKESARNAILRYYFRKQY